MLFTGLLEGEKGKRANSVRECVYHNCAATDTIQWLEGWEEQYKQSIGVRKEGSNHEEGCYEKIKIKKKQKWME